VAVRVDDVPMFFSWTEALGTTAPVLSVTVP
jgi:hypothetical protein